MKSTLKILIAGIILIGMTGCTASTAPGIDMEASPSLVVTAVPSHQPEPKDTPSLEPSPTLPPKPFITPWPTPAVTPGNISQMTIPQKGDCVIVTMGQDYALIEDSDLAARLLGYIGHLENPLLGGAACPMDNHVAVYRDGALAEDWLMAADSCRTVLRDNVYYLMPMALYIDLYYAAQDRGLYMDCWAHQLYCVAKMSAYRINGGAVIKEGEWSWILAEDDRARELTEAVFGAFTKAYYALTSCEMDDTEALNQYIEVEWEEPDWNTEKPPMSMFSIWGGESDYFVIEGEDGSRAAFRGVEMREVFSALYP